MPILTAVRGCGEGVAIVTTPRMEENRMNGGFPTAMIASYDILILILAIPFVGGPVRLELRPVLGVYVRC